TRPWRASSPRSRRSTSTRSASAPARRRRRPCSNTSKSSTIGSVCIRPSAIAPRPRRGPAWKGSPCVQPHDALISPLHSTGGSPMSTVTLAQDKSREVVGSDAKVVLKTTKTMTDQPLSYPQSGKPEITITVVTMQPDGHTSLHKHPSPTVGYVIEGFVEV